MRAQIISAGAVEEVPSVHKLKAISKTPQVIWAHHGPYALRLAALRLSTPLNPKSACNHTDQTVSTRGPCHLPARAPSRRSTRRMARTWPRYSTLALSRAICRKSENAHRWPESIPREASPALARLKAS